MSNVISVFLNEDPYLTNVIVQLVTRSGAYLDKNQARRLISEGSVLIDGTQERKHQAILNPGLHQVTVGMNTYTVKVVPSATE